MRIVGGKWAGRELTSPAGRVRPTSEEVRRACMEALREDLRGARVLELYAGTGAVGLEALSRGAKSCDFVETSPSALHALKANVAATRSRDQTRIFKRDALRFIDTIPDVGYDLAFADPPYGSQQLDRLLERWLASPFSGVLAVEHATDHLLPSGDLSLLLGETRITIFRTTH
jgi:16S rRNA (guanine966-N2)-methyltransferase